MSPQQQSEPPNDRQSDRPPPPGAAVAEPDTAPTVVIDNAGDRPLMPYHCGAKNKAGKPCRARAMANGRCRIHGGKSLAGIASPAYKHGGYSNYLSASIPARLRDKFTEAFNDRELLDLRGCVAILAVRTSEAMEKLGQCDTSGFRDRLSGLADDLEKANAAKDAAAIGSALTAIVKTIRAGSNEQQAWNDVRAAVRDLMDAVARENQRLVSMGQILTIPQAAAFLATLFEILKRNITDPRLLHKIGVEIGQRVGLARSQLPRLPPLMDVDPAEDAGGAVIDGGVDVGDDVTV